VLAGKNIGDCGFIDAGPVCSDFRTEDSTSPEGGATPGSSTPGATNPSSQGR
jgi:hypothetical protein